MSNSDDQSQTETEDCQHSPVSPSTVKKRFNRQTSSSLGGSGRKNNLSRQIITVQKEDGDIGHIEVNVPDEHFSTQQSILQSLAELGEIPNPAPASPVPGKLKEVLRRGSMAVGALNLGQSSDPSMPKFEVPEEIPDSKTGRSGSTLLTPALLEDLKKDRKRIIAKGGQCNVALENVPHKRVQFFKDIFTTMVDMQWRFTFLSFMASFFISWVIFTVLYYIVAAYRGDLEPEHLPDSEMYTSGAWKPCIWACYDFTSYFLFSMETQHTIGYGSRQTTEKCPEAIILVCLQSILGVMISSVMAGVVFAKLARPKARTHTVMFSKNAVITMRNGQLVLMFRVGNMRKSHLIEAHMRAQMIYHRKVSKEGDVLNYETEELAITTTTVDEVEDMDSEFSKEDRTLFIFPTFASHRIDKDSPFYNWGPKDILNTRFELLVTLEGVVEPTGNSTQSRSSYLPNEILWGHHYENMVSYSKKRGTYVVDCSNLNAVVPDETPRMSRADYEEKLKSDVIDSGESPDVKANGHHVSRVQIESSMSTETIATTA